MVRQRGRVRANELVAYVRHNPFLVLHNVMALTLLLLIAVWKAVLVRFATTMPSELLLQEPVSMLLARVAFVITSIEFSRRYARSKGWSDPAVYGPLVVAAFFAPTSPVHDSTMSLMLAVGTVVATVVWTIDMRRA